MKRLCLLALLSLSFSARASSGGADQAYARARKDYYRLKRDPARRKFRDNWLKVAHRFEDVARRYPNSERAPDALFTAAQLYNELSEISRVGEDLDAALGDYKKLLAQHPRHHLADDAAFALAKAELERLDRPEDARTILSRALRSYPRGDRAREIKNLLASLPADEHPKIAKADKPHPPAKPHAEVSEPRPIEVAAHVPAKVAEEPQIDVQEPEPLDVSPLPVANPQTAKARLKELSHADGGEVTLAEQLGLKVRKVVIDAGHGGHDSGAVGPTGVQEKRVSLAIAKRVAKALTAQGLEVVLTRDDDRFVRLEDRTRIANEAHGDLFISIHCNSEPGRKLHGIETYTLNTSSDRYSIRLAARENSASERGISDLQFILADLATKANTDESTRLASKVQHSLVSELSGHYAQIKDLGEKQALFYVLIGAKMPAILVETSFISNPTEEKRLASPGYQDQVAQAIADGVEDFLGDRERVARVP